MDIAASLQLTVGLGLWSFLLLTLGDLTLRLQTLLDLLLFRAGSESTRVRPVILVLITMI